MSGGRTMAGGWRDARRGVAALLAALAAALPVGQSAHAQCTFTCPAGSVQQNDTCNNPFPDPNGGCSLVPAKIQLLGTVAPGAPIHVCGTVGTYGTNFRDIDCYRFTLAAPALVQVSARHKNTSGMAVPNFTIALFDGADCATATIVESVVGGGCPLVANPVPLPAGNYLVFFTVDAFGPSAPACPVTYWGTIDAVAPIPSSCGPAAGACGTVHGTPGCNDLECCDAVCSVFSSCCSSPWDETCVEFAFALCGLFDHVCIAPGPANDCASTVLSGAAAAFDVNLPFANSTANTDGPYDEPCTSLKDVWFLVKAPAAGQISVDGTAVNFDTILSVYLVGTSPATFNPDLLPGGFLGCVDAEGGEAVALKRVAANDHYLIRIAGYNGATGTGTIRFSFVPVLFDTGNTNKPKFDMTGAGNHVLQDVGMSSGNLSAAQPQRWTAQAFTLPSAGAGFAWSISSIHAYGDEPAGVTNDTLEFVIWKRTGLAAPGAADQVVSGSTDFPDPVNIPGGGDDEDHEILPSFTLAGGDYWLAVYAGSGAAPKNFAWYLNAPNGINNIDGTGAARAWRSATYPSPGFLSFTLPAATLMQAPGLDPNDLYNTGFRILGSKVAAAPPCPSDFDGSGCVNGADLGLLLGAWGNPYGGPDLGAMLAAWGACPGVPPGSCP